MTAGDVIVLAAIAVIVGLALRSIRKSRKKGGCSGNCATCGCSCGSSHKSHS